MVETLIGIGANLPAPDGASPLATCQRACAGLAESLGRLGARSPWYLSAPVPPSDQPWFINGVAVLDTDLGAQAVLAALHGLERSAGRRRRKRWEARVLDLDLLAYGDQVIEDAGGLELPHPRLSERLFVLVPLADVAPRWRHPRSRLGIGALLAARAGDRRPCRLPGSAGAAS